MSSVVNVLAIWLDDVLVRHLSTSSWSQLLVSRVTTNVAAFVTTICLKFSFKLYRSSTLFGLRLAEAR